jgi:hypothetical protein
MADGLARRLADFFDRLAPTRAARRAVAHDPDVERHRLATQLLGTLSIETLADTGHLKRPVLDPPARARRARRPQPPPVGDLSRPRVPVI